MNKWLDRYESGGLVSKNSLNRNVICSNCGWSWKLSNGGLDPMTCHKCGGDIKMREGGELDKYQDRGQVNFKDQLYQQNRPVIDATAAPIVLPGNLFYDKTRVVNGSSAGLNKFQLKEIYQNLKNKAFREKQAEIENYKAAELFHNNNPVAKLLGTRSAPASNIKPTAKELANGLGAGINEFYEVPGIGIANDFVNPLSLVSKGIISPWMQAPLQAQQSDSYLPYVGAALSTALTVPMVRPASIAAKTILNPKNISRGILESKLLYNDIATGNSIIPYAWKSPAVNLDASTSQAMFDKVLNSRKFTDAEKAMVREFQFNSGSFTNPGLKQEQFNSLIKKVNVEFPKDAVATRRFHEPSAKDLEGNSSPDNYLNTVFESVEGDPSNFKSVSIQNRPSAFSVGIGDGKEANFGQNRVVLSGKNLKKVEGNFVKNNYEAVPNEYYKNFPKEELPFVDNSPDNILHSYYGASRKTPEQIKEIAEAYYNNKTKDGGWLNKSKIEVKDYVGKPKPGTNTVYTKEEAEKIVMQHNKNVDLYGNLDNKEQSIQKLIDEFSNSGFANNNKPLGEREIIGSGFDMKVIGKVKNDLGGHDYIVKPKNIKGALPKIPRGLDDNATFINLERASPKLKSKMYKASEVVDDPNFNIKKIYRGDKENPKIIKIQGKSGEWTVNKSNDGSYYFNAAMSSPLESGKAMLKINEMLPPKPTILEPNSLSLDSYLNTIKIGKRPHWKMEFENYIPLNHSAINNKTISNKFGFKPEGTQVPFNSLEDANIALKEVNAMLKKQGITQKADIFSNGNNNYGIKIPNFKLTRDYKNGGAIITNRGQWLDEYKIKGEYRGQVPTSDVMQNRVPIGMQQIPTDPLTGQPLTREQISRFMPSFNTQQPVISQGTWKGNRTTKDNSFDPYSRIIEQDPQSEANIGKRMRKDLVTKKLPVATAAAAAIMAAPLAAPIVSSAMSAPLTIGSTILPYVTPATLIGAGFGLTGANNLANNLQSGYYFNPKISKSEKIFTGLTTGLDMLGTPGAVEAIGSHLITPAYRSALKAGKYLTEETALKNAYKLNPQAIKENPEMFLYRAEPSNFNSQSTIDFMKQEIAAGRGKPWYKGTIRSYEEGHPKIMAQNDFHGQWFEKDPDRLDFYLNSGDKYDAGTPMDIIRKKIPTSEASNFSVANNAQANVISASPNTEFVLPRNIVNSAERFPQNSWQQLIQEDKAFNTPHWLKGYGKKSNLKVFTEGQPYEGAPHIHEDMVPINGRYQPRTVITDAGVKDEILGLEATPIIPLNQIEYPVTSNKFLYGPHNSFGKMEQGVVTDTYRGMPPGSTNTYTSTLPSYTSFPNNNIIQPWVAQELPGLHLKSTLKGSPLEKQLSKTGDININNIKSYIAKADVGQQDKFIIDKVLNEKFSGVTKINYNDFRKAVSEELVPLERNIINNYEHNNWGLGKLGYPSAKKSSFDAAIKNSKQEIDRLENLLKDKGNIEPTSWETSDQIRQRLQLQLDDIKTQYAKSIAEYENLPLENSSITYSNQSKFGKGSADHFDESTLGHARTLVSKEEPDVMHFLEQQSDHWQKGGKQKPIDVEKYKEVLAKKETSYANDLEVLKKLKETKKDYAGNPKSDYEIQQFEDIVNKKGAELQLRKGDIANPIQKEFLGKNHQERLLQENVAYAAEQGKSKVRVPTSETAVKIQGYKPITQSPKPERVNRLKESIAHQKEMVSKRINPDGRPMNQGDIDHYEMNIMGLEEELYTKTKYSPEYETILKKYSEQPKTIKKLFGVEPKVVTDSKGNSWYEFDIPDAAKKGKFEIKAFRNGGGVIEDNRGQWAHPGQVTRINSNNITMQGVPYPVVGVDNTGHTKMMQPGMNYTFPGQYVTEYPMMQPGGQKNPTIYVTDPNDRGLQMYKDSSALYHSYLRNLDRLKQLGLPVTQTDDKDSSSDYNARFNKTLRSFPEIRKRAKDRGHLLEKNMYEEGVLHPYLVQGKDVFDELVNKSLKTPKADTLRTMEAAHKTIKPVGLDKVFPPSVIEDTYDGTRRKKREWVTDASGKIINDTGFQEEGKNVNFKSRIIENTPLFTQRYAEPVQPVELQSKTSTSMQSLHPWYMQSSPISMQGQPIQIQPMVFPQQHGRPVYGPGNTIIGYSNDNMKFNPAYQYTGAPNNQFNLQDKELLNNPELLKQYIYNQDSGYHYKGGGEIPLAQNGKQVKKSSNIVSRENVSGDALTSTLKRELAASFPYLQSLGKSIEKGISYITPDYKSQEDRELLFRRHRPVAYPSVSSGLADVVRDYSSRIFNTEIHKPFRDKEGDYEASEEAWRMTLGLPVKSKYIIPSAYRPLNETNKASKYYTLNEKMYNKDLLRKKVEELKLKPGQSALINSFAPFINENYMNRDEFSQVDPIQNFQIGVNKKGKMYFYDKYDFDFEPATKVVKPYEYEFYNEFKTGGEMIKRADGSYSKRGLWDNIRDNRGSGKAPTKQMLDQERKIRNQYQTGGQIPTVQGNFKKQNEYGYMVTDEEALAKEAQRLNSKRVLTEGGSLIIFDDNWNIIAADDNPSAPYKQGGSVTLNAGGEQHKIYVKSTNRGEGDKGHIMVNHPTMDKGMWDTIDLTQKAGAKTIAQGVAATKEWHRENPYMKQRGGERNNNLKNINLNLPVIRHQEMNPLHINGFLANDRNQNLFIGGINPRYQNEDFSVGPYMIGVGNKYFQKFPADMGMSGTYHVNDNFDINIGAGQNNVNAGIKYNFANGGYVVRRSHDRKGKTHVVTGPDGTKKYFGDPNMGERGKSKYGKEAFYARHKSNLAKNPYFRAYARATWKEGGETMAIGGQTMMNPVTRKDNRNWLDFLKN